MEEQEFIHPSIVADRESPKDFESLFLIHPQKFFEMYYHLEMAVSNTHRQETQKGNWNYIPFSHLTFYKTLLEVNKDKNFQNLSTNIYRPTTSNY